MNEHSITENPFPFIRANVHSMAMRKPIYGVGINNAPYQVQPAVDGKQVHCHYYKTWKNMLKRVYCPIYQSKNNTYIGTSICDKWHHFTAFREWMIMQDWQNNELDKDLKFPGNREYSPEACIFVPGHVNRLLTDRRAARGRYPKGVCWDKDRKKFIAGVSIGPGSSKYIGRFATPEEASAAYIVAKSNRVREVAMQQTEPLRSILLQWT